MKGHLRQGIEKWPCSSAEPWRTLLEPPRGVGYRPTRNTGPPYFTPGLNPLHSHLRKGYVAVDA